ncbi:MAG TPA: signal peptidase I [Candidatus Angelobacter sp.]|nr:signal peptidase I [Candidatus Angelobacter sp.]
MPSLDSRRTKNLLIAGNLVLVFIVATIVRPVRISAHSMENTLCDGQLVLVETFPASIPKRADIIVLRIADPNMGSGGQGDLVIKRIVGLPGDRIRIVRGTVLVNGNPLDEPYVHHGPLYQRASDSWPVDTNGAGQRDIVVPEGNLFVLGDNRGQSLDSRVWGPVAQQDVVGYLLFKLNSGTSCRD